MRGPVPLCSCNSPGTACPPFPIRHWLLQTVCSLGHVEKLRRHRLLCNAVRSILSGLRPLMHAAINVQKERQPPLFEAEPCGRSPHRSQEAADCALVASQGGMSHLCWDLAPASSGSKRSPPSAAGFVSPLGALSPRNGSPWPSTHQRLH